MITVKDILDYLDKLYPISTACDFDNAGLLVGDSKSIVKIAVVSLDCDIDTVNFAKDNGANLIVTHHPVIFDPLKSVTDNGIVYMLIKNDISVISMHTNLDIAKNGVTDTLCKALSLKSIKPYTAGDGFLLRRGKTDAKNADEFALLIKEKLGGSVRYVGGNKPIKNILVCSGSGGGYIDEAVSGGFDALVTADVKHNQFITAINSGISLFDAGHYNSENIIIYPLCETLKKHFGDVSFTAVENKKIKSL